MTPTSVATVHAAIYAGWILVDARMVAFVLGVSLLMTLGIFAIFVKNRRWYDYLMMGAGLFVAIVLVLSVGFALALNRAPILVESLFAVP